MKSKKNAASTTKQRKKGKQKDYEAPRLTRYGSLKSLTLGSGPGFDEECALTSRDTPTCAS